MAGLEGYLRQGYLRQACLRQVYLRLGLITASASTTPAPTSLRLPGMRLAARMRLARTCAGVRFDFDASRSAATPLACAAAMEVPEVTWYFPSGATARISTPGAATATCGPRFACGISLSSTSVAVTPMTPGSAAGKSGGDRGPALPTAAISTMPRALAL